MNAYMCTRVFYFAYSQSIPKEESVGLSRIFDWHVISRFLSELSESVAI